MTINITKVLLSLVSGVNIYSVGYVPYDLSIRETVLEKPVKSFFGILIPQTFNACHFDAIFHNCFIQEFGIFSLKISGTNRPCNLCWLTLHLARGFAVLFPNFTQLSFKASETSVVYVH